MGCKLTDDRKLDKKEMQDDRQQKTWEKKKKCGKRDMRSCLMKCMTKLFWSSLPWSDCGKYHRCSTFPKVRHALRVCVIRNVKSWRVTVDLTLTNGAATFRGRNCKWAAKDHGLWFHWKCDKNVLSFHVYSGRVTSVREVAGLVDYSGHVVSRWITMNIRFGFQ